ncbi:MAG: TolC family protein [Pseudomonadota bacterium]
MLLAAFALLAGAAPAFATEPALPGRDVASIRAWLLERNPELRALQAEAEAARARIQPAGALPDPMASVSVQELDPDRPWQARDEGAASVQLRQRFPLWGKRSLAREVATHEAEAMRLEREATARTLLAEAEAAYVRYWHADQAVAVLDRRIALLERIEEIAGVRYALGLAAQQDAIRAQVERTAMQRERIERLAARSEAAAALNRALGRRADEALAEPAAPPALSVQAPTLEALLQTLDGGRHPMVQARQALAEAARSNVELQYRNRYPDITLGVGRMRRFDGMDSAELMLEVEIPLQQRARRERERESRLLEDAALARAEAARRSLQGEAGMAWAQWQSARERRRLTETTLLPQADANFRSALASYQVGEVDFGTLLEALNAWQGADLARVDALRDELLGAAAVRALEGDTR